MKIRNGFVTNSSSSSFIISSINGVELTNKQKDALVEFVLEHLFGKVILTPKSTPEEIHEYFVEADIDEEADQWDDTAKSKRERVLALLKSGKSLREGIISYEDGNAEYELTNIYKGVWKAVMENGDNFKLLGGDIRY